MTRPRILVAGVGNIFLGDDGFGVEVAQRLARRALPEEVRVVDFGIRGLDLTYALLDGYEAVILVDAAPRGDQPGTLYVLDVTGSASPEGTDAVPVIEAHSMDPAKVLRLAAAMGGRVERLLLVGCKPATAVEPNDVQVGLSDPVRAAVDEAVVLIESLVVRLLRGESALVEQAHILSQQETGPCRE
jgi:hydrogenase maturation protease